MEFNYSTYTLPELEFALAEDLKKLGTYSINTFTLNPEISQLTLEISAIQEAIKEKQEDNA